MELSELVLSVCMERCIDLARRTPLAVGRPMVGAMVVSGNGNIVGEGYKRLLSGTSFVQHAERTALDLAGEQAMGGYLFTTLEPCLEKKSEVHVFCSCSKLIINRKIGTVVVGLLDQSPSMKAGSGISYLQSRGVNVILYDTYKNKIAAELMPSRYKRPKPL
ncbi:MAG: hypothetical protein AABW53_02405 [Nanoarchaeota archaeon]